MANKSYEITKDPFAIVAFILLLFTIVVFLALLTVTAGLSSFEVWHSMHRQTRKRRTSDLEQEPDDGIPLMSLTPTSNHHAQSEAGPSSKKVRFSELVDTKMVPGLAGEFDNLFEEWYELNAQKAATGRGERQTMSERQFAELYLPTG